MQLVSIGRWLTGWRRFFHSLVWCWAGASRQETTRWRRDWLGSVLKTRSEQYASLIETMDSKYIVLSRAVGGDSVGQERFDVSAEAWRSQRARSRIFAGPRAQDAAEQFDRARESVILAINEKSPKADSAVALLVDARIAMIDAVNDDLMDMNRGGHPVVHVAMATHAPAQSTRKLSVDDLRPKPPSEPASAWPWRDAIEAQAHSTRRPPDRLITKTDTR